MRELSMHRSPIAAMPPRSHALSFIIWVAGQSRVARCRNTDDTGLPGEDGFAPPGGLRRGRGRVGIVMVTAASEAVDRVVGLETGADAWRPTTSRRLWDRRGRPLPGRSHS